MRSQEVSDEQLAEGAAIGRIEAFELLVTRHHAHFYRLAYRILFHAEDAEELVQEAFLKLWTGKARFKDAYKTQFKSWFTRIVINQARDELRKRARQKKKDLADVTLSVEAVQSLELEQQETKGQVGAALKRLPDRQRMAIVLFYYSELPQKQAADVMGVSQKAFESLLSRAKGTLRQELGEARYAG